MNPLSVARTHWRITLLVVLVLLSAAFLFLPYFAPADATVGNATDAGDETEADPAAERGLTNLVFGLDLSGGTRVRAPLAGFTAEGLTFDQDRATDIEDEIAANLDLSSRDVAAFAGPEGEAAVEVRTDEVTEEEVAAAVETAGFDDAEIRTGVTEDTVDEAVGVLEDKIRESAFARGDARKSTAASGEQFVVVEVPNQNRSEVIDLIEEQGIVEVVAMYPTEDGYENETVLEEGDFQQINPPQEGSQGPYVPVTLTEEAAGPFSETMQEEGFTGEGVDACRYAQNPDDPGYCLVTVVDGEVTDAHSMGETLAESMNTGEYLNTRGFQMQASTMDDARSHYINLRAGSLPAPLDIEAGTQYFLEPSLAEEFKFLSLVTGLVAVVAVAGVVGLRYRDPRVGIPMILTASAEVFLLMGFAAAIGYPLDLAAIAGFIAVVGTGVDDLIIIADEILQEGDVSTGRVFESRFRKAFWVIGAAAATTIIAMAPLAFLSLGDLTGFALITIIGVLIGVLITRPAYGDILRILLTER